MPKIKKHKGTITEASLPEAKEAVARLKLHGYKNFRISKAKNPIDIKRGYRYWITYDIPTNK